MKTRIEKFNKWYYRKQLFRLINSLIGTFIYLYLFIKCAMLFVFYNIQPDNIHLLLIILLHLEFSPSKNRKRMIRRRVRIIKNRKEIYPNE